MIVQEFFMQREDGVNLIRTFSNENLKIQKVGTSELYEDAIDIENAGFHYIETNIHFEPVVLPKEDTSLSPEINSTSPNEEEFIENGDQELTNDEIAAMLEEVL